MNISWIDSDRELQSLLQGSPIAWGAQDVSVHEQGAYTGEVSVSMLKDFGCRYAIVGHSERRQYHFETDEVVAAKAQRALAAGITPIVCVGETLAERDAGKADKVVAGQVDGSMPVGEGALDAVAAGKVAVAYEPVWAIGTGRTPTVEDIGAMHRAIRALLVDLYGAEQAATVRILYGGSVNAENARDLLSADEVGGALVGGASLTAESFLGIVVAAADPVDS